MTVLALAGVGPACLEAAAAPAPADPYWEVLVPGEPLGPETMPQVLAKKLDRKRLRAQKRPIPYNQPSQAQEFFLLKRVPGQGQPLPVERYLDALRHMRDMPRHSTRVGGPLMPSPQAVPTEPPTSLAASTPALGTWTPLGPGNIGGRTRAILIDPTSPGTMYAAGVAGGVWKTTTGGASWAPLTDLIANLAVNSLAMDPSNPNVVYAGTGEGYYNIDGVRGAGIFKTTDGGGSWTHLASTTSPNFYYVNKIVVSPNNAQRVYAATRTGVWRSMDGGGSWAQVLSAAITGGCLDLAIRSDQPTDYLFASCGTFVQATIYRNTDAGGAGSWVGVFTEASMGRTSLAIAPSSPWIIYALAASIAPGTYEDGLHAVFRSQSSGDPGTWTARVRNSNPTKLNTVLLTNTVFAFLAECGWGASAFYNQGWYDNVIAVDPADPNRVWAGGIDLFRSDDGGANWGMASHWWASSANPRYAHADQHTIVFHPQYNGGTNTTMFVGNDGGVFQTSAARAATATGSTAPCDTQNGGVSWTEQNNGYGVTQFYHGAPYPGGATYFGGTQDNGTIRGTDGAGIDGWTEILGGDGGFVAIDPANPSILYAENTGRSMQKSVDGGVSFFDATVGIAESDANFLFIAPFTMDPGNSLRLWTGGYYLWRTINGARRWNQASRITAGTGSVSAIAVAPTDANRVLAGMSDGIIHRTAVGLSSTGSTSWPFVQPRTGYVSWLTFDPTNANIAYATYSSFGGTHVWKSLDGGASWTGIDGSGSTAVPDIPVHSIVVDPTTPSRLYVGTDLGVFVSRDGGASWAIESGGFANVITEALAVGNVGATPHIFAFTHGRGAWRVASADAGAGTNPVPAITTLAPSSATVGGPGFTLTVNGSGFVPTSVVRWNGASRTTTYVGASQLQAAIAAADIASTGSAQVTVLSPAPGGGVSGAATFTVTGIPPSITTPSPLPAGAVSAAYSQILQATGGATPYGWSQVNGALPPGLGLSAAGVLSGTPATAGTYAFRVRVTGADALFSEKDFSLTINNPVPAITGLSPSSATVGGPGFTLTVNGSGFVPTSVVRWNGASRTTTYVGASQLQAAIAAADIASSGSAQVTVFNPTPGGGVSGAATFTIIGVAPTITTPSPLPAGAVTAAYSQTLQATGGAAPYGWSQVSGALPPGLGLSASGVLSGTPTVQGTFAFRVRVTGADALFSEKDFSLAIAAAPPTTKDLIIVNLALSSSSVNVNSTVTVSYGAQNVGTVTVTETYTERIYLSTISTLDGTAVPLALSAGHPGPLAAGATLATSQTVTIADTTVPGPYYILVQADALGAVPESDESNNVAAIPITIAPRRRDLR